MVEDEWRLFRERACNPERFLVGGEKREPLMYWQTKDVQTKVVELLIAFEALKEFYSPRGILLEFHELVAIAEQVLGIRIKNFRQLKKTVLDRGKSVVLLKQLERLIEQVRDGMDK